MPKIYDFSFLFPKQGPTLSTLFGTVSSVGASTFGVIVDGSDDEVEAIKGVSASVGDRVFCIITELGTLVAVCKCL